MGGKTLKFPRRRKYVPPEEKVESNVDDKPISEEEHQKKIDLLKSFGLLKEDK